MSRERADLVGRERHLRELGLLVDGVGAGRGSFLTLSGEAGAGKTRLAEEAGAQASIAGVDVTWATGWGEGAPPLSTWLDLVDGLGFSEAASAPQLAADDVDPEVARSLLVRSIVGGFRAGIGDRKVLLIVDDAQWCDPLSRHVLRALTGAVRTMAVGVLATIRDDGAATAADLVTFARGGRHLVVPPLSEPELEELARRITGRDLPPAAAARLRDRSGGNVLFARELLVGWRHEDGTEARAFAELSAAALFAGRFSELSTACARLLEVASVIGRRFRLDVVAEVAGEDPSAVLELVDEAHVAGLVRTGGIGTYEFCHPLMAEASYARTGLPRRVRLHRDVGEALERLRARGMPVAAAELAHHFSHAAPAGVADKAVQYGLAAGQENMAQLAYEDAARTFGQALKALDLCSADDAARADVLLDLGDAEAAVGDLPTARGAYEAAAKLARGFDSPDRFARAALGVGSGPGGFEVPAFDREQIALLEEAAALSEGSQRAQILARLSVALSLDLDTRRRADLSQQAIRAGREADDPVALGYAQASWCDVIAGPTDVGRRLDATVEILDCAARAGDTRLELLGRRLRVVALLESGRLPAADEEINAFAERAERLGQVGYAWYVPLWRAMRATAEGRLEDADRLRREAARLGELAHSENAAMLTGSQLAMLRCELADPSAIPFFEDVMARWPGLTVMARPGLAYGCAAIGDLGRAHDVLSSMRIDDYAVDALGSEWLPSVVMFAYATALTGDKHVAQDLYDTLNPFRGRHAIDGIGCYDLGSVDRPLGMLAATVGDATLAADHFGVALEHHRQLGAQLLVAGTLRDAARSLDDPNRLDEARRSYTALGIDGTSGGATPSHAAAAAATQHEATDTNVFRRDGELWLVGLAGTANRIKDSKGLSDLAQLLARAGSEVHVLDLVSTGPTLRSDAPGDAIDESARRQYRDRLLELDVELAEADERADIVRSEGLAAERDALLAELSGAYGLGGRARRRSDSTERARSAVTQRIRVAITRIEHVDAQLGGHLRRSIRTGTFCSYVPDHPTNWQL